MTNLGGLYLQKEEYGPGDGFMIKLFYANMKTGP